MEKFITGKVLRIKDWVLIPKWDTYSNHAIKAWWTWQKTRRKEYLRLNEEHSEMVSSVNGVPMEFMNTLWLWLPPQELCQIKAAKLLAHIKWTTSRSNFFHKICLEWVVVGGGRILHFGECGTNWIQCILQKNMYIKLEEIVEENVRNVGGINRGRYDCTSL